jgi:bacillolysin
LGTPAAQRPEASFVTRWFSSLRTATGALLATYTGNVRHGATSPCITTPTGSVQLTSGSSVVAQGFTVDAVVPC